MPKKYLILIIGCWLLGHHLAFAQISPGDLTEAHAHLEGIGNCTQCHTLGAKVDNQKCLDCHKWLDERISSNKGYHVSAEVKGKDCFACHSEHHGRGFEMIRFNTDDFDHDLTGYPLKGAHKKQDCRDCHKADFIIDARADQREKTYLGLTTECLLCHADHHRNTLSAKCQSCHDMEAFSPATYFDHDKTNYTLKGRHKEVDCRSCHISDDDSMVSVFEGVAYADCDACHEDVHNGRLQSDCKVCHEERGFDLFTGGQGFAHDRTGFPLEGAHKRQECRACHDMEAPREVVFSDHSGVDPLSCTVCHEDAHQGRFGLDCRKCHGEQSWAISTTPEAFDHNLTHFALEGRHALVDCRACHVGALTDPLPHGQCLDCHSDHHEGQFMDEGLVRDCAACHTVYGFETSSFGFEDHEMTSFPLTGAHMATPCSFCHLNEEDTWVFRKLGTKCLDCHDNVHEGEMTAEYYSGKDGCASCHSTDTWSMISFDHDLTQFALEGRHLDVDCRACHQEDEAYQFSGVSSDCFACHEEPHRGQFAENGVTKCSECHDPSAWKPSTFDHDSARFVLDGAHIKVACDECHLQETDELGIFIRYKNDHLACIDCHK